MKTPLCRQCNNRTCGHVTRRQRRAAQAEQLFPATTRRRGSGDRAAQPAAPPKIVWFARGGGMTSGPFDDQLTAVDYLRLARDPHEFPSDAFVWPEFAK